MVVGSHGVGQVIRVERLPVAGETICSLSYDVSPDGGKGSNQAIAIGRLGGTAAFVGVVGRDNLGDLGERWLQEAGVDTRFLMRSDTRGTSTGIIIVDADGMNTIIDCGHGPEDELTVDCVESCVRSLEGAKVLLTGFEIPVASALHAARVAKELGMVTVVNPGPAPSEAMGCLSFVDILVPNESEGKLIAHLDVNASYPPMDLAREIRDSCAAGCVIVTLGADGSVGLDAKGLWTVKATHVPVVDTTGAGDAFCAALACGLATGKSAREASEWASIVAAHSVSRCGSIPSFPTTAEVDGLASGPGEKERSK